MEIKRIIEDSVRVKEALLKDEHLLRSIQDAVDVVVSCFRQSGKLLLCGNGGSASDAQHIAAEFTGRFKMERRPLYAEALHTNTSYLTAVGNDYGFDKVYARLIESNSISGDVLFAFSTSGNSENIVQACIKAKEKGLTVVGFTGADGGKMLTLCDILIKVPSENTARIQETHILIGHIICELSEKALFA